jgi:putative spermidine/putrescine transport system ATP-binding protein
MSGLVITELNKSFGNFRALRDISFEVQRGLFVCLLGPSGCGKTTLLRLIAGLDAPTSGRIMLDGVDLTDIPAHRRDFGMVFQSLALFPHLNVGQNIAYAMAIRGASKPDQAREVERLLDLVRLPGIAKRSIGQLSGGQRQRVAIARALALTPKLFLLDEPMSALDAKLREALQIELKLLQERLSVTTVLVTHDQREALTMADLVVVMSEGKIQQIAPPMDVYRRPANAFVADFIGTTNLLTGEALGQGSVRLGEAVLTVKGAATPGPITLSIRPESLRLSNEPGGNRLEGSVMFVRHLGANAEVSVDVGIGSLVALAPERDQFDVQSGQSIYVSIDPDGCVVVS